MCKVVAGNLRDNWGKWSGSMNIVPEAKWATVQGRVQSSAKLCKQCCIIIAVYHSERTGFNVLLICLVDNGVMGFFFLLARMLVTLWYSYLFNHC